MQIIKGPFRSRNFLINFKRKIVEKVGKRILFSILWESCAERGGGDKLMLMIHSFIVYVTFKIQINLKQKSHGINARSYNI